MQALRDGRIIGSKRRGVFASGNLAKGDAMSTQQPGSTSNSSQQSGGGHAQHDETASVGHATSGAAGSTRGHETQRETGGSGGAGLTANQVGGKPGAASQSSGAPSGTPTGAPSRQGEAPQDGPVVRDSGARGAQDTRSRQAGGSETGLGSPDSGANQTSADLEHKN
jgi:hypothetical protein